MPYWQIYKSKKSATTLPYLCRGGGATRRNCPFLGNKACNSALPSIWRSLHNCNNRYGYCNCRPLSYIRNWKHYSSRTHSWNGSMTLWIMQSGYWQMAQSIAPVQHLMQAWKYQIYKQIPLRRRIHNLTLNLQRMTVSAQTRKTGASMMRQQANTMPKMMTVNVS